jgi:hypothetical protein
MARRVIAGPPLFNESWVELDEEIKTIEKRVLGAKAAPASLPTSGSVVKSS